MARKSSTSFSGSNFSLQTIQAVWNKGRIITGYNPNEWRYDACGNLMHFQSYGNRNSKYGWEVDHIFPVSKGGKDHINNLQPLYWKNNAAKSDTFPWSCSMR